MGEFMPPVHRTDRKQSDYLIGYADIFQLNTRLHRNCRVKGFESLHLLSDFFDKAMSLFYNIIEVFYLPDVNMHKQPAHHKKQCQLQVNGINAGLIGATFIHDDLVRNPA